LKLIFYMILAIYLISLNWTKVGLKLELVRLYFSLIY